MRKGRTRNEQQNREGGEGSEGVRESEGAEGVGGMRRRRSMEVTTSDRFASSRSTASPTDRMRSKHCVARISW